MNLDRMNMALTLARFEHRRLHLSAAGMSTGPDLPSSDLAGGGGGPGGGRPLGSMADATYDQWSSDLEPGDTGSADDRWLPRATRWRGVSPLGYRRVREIFAATAGEAPESINHLAGPRRGRLVRRRVTQRRHHFPGTPRKKKRVRVGTLTRSSDSPAGGAAGAWISVF